MRNLVDMAMGWIRVEMGMVQLPRSPLKSTKAPAVRRSEVGSWMRRPMRNSSSAHLMAATKHMTKGIARHMRREGWLTDVGRRPIRPRKMRSPAVARLAPATARAFVCTKLLHRVFLSASGSR